VTNSLCRCLLIAFLAWLSFPAFAAAPSAVNPRQTWQLLDYVAVDYGAAVKSGSVASEAEYAEMREFAGAVRTQLAALPSTPGQAGLIAQADQLVTAVESKADARHVADLAHRLADGLLANYPVGAVPATPPDPARGAQLYAAQCTACHGPAGHGDGPAAASLDPPPIAFTDATRAAQRSPFALYEAISQGIQGTAMTGFSSLPEADRWALAFYVGSLSHSPQMRAEGEALWRDAPAWQQYLHAKVSAALTRRSAVFLFLLAFVAVYREVFETILFFIAMWNQENSTAILGGLVAGSVVLAGVAYWMLRMSKRLPIGQFFSISSILIAVLAVVLVGKGIAALQEAGWVGQALVAAPRIDWLGVYPSWQSLLAQLAVAVIAIGGFYFNARNSRVPAQAVKGDRAQ